MILLLWTWLIFLKGDLLFDSENWKLVPLFDNYEVSDYGRVYNNQRDRLLSGSIRNDGFVRVVLTQNGILWDVKLHHLVADLYLEDYNKGMHVRHIDGNKRNNSVWNLEPLGPNRSMGPLYFPEYKGGRLVMIEETGEIFPNVMTLAIELETDVSTIYKCLRGERQRHLGYTFRYVD